MHVTPRSVCNYGIKNGRGLEKATADEWILSGPLSLCLSIPCAGEEPIAVDLSLYLKSPVSRICGSSYEVYRPYTFSRGIFIGPVGRVSLNWPWKDRRNEARRIGKERGWGWSYRDSMRRKWAETWRWTGQWTINIDSFLSPEHWPMRIDLTGLCQCSRRASLINASL